MSASADSSLDDANQQLVNFLVHEEVARHVTAMYTLERIAARDWARVRPLMASINQVSPPPPSFPCFPPSCSVKELAVACYDTFDHDYIMCRPLVKLW